MQRRISWKCVLSVCLATVVAAGAARAEDKKKDTTAKPGPFDSVIHANLREVINHGANLYNQGDWNGCYHLWEGSLMSLKPMLRNRSKLQEAIDMAIVSAKQEPMLWRRAFVLRSALDQVRSELKGNALDKDDDKPLDPKNNVKPVESPKPPKPKTLWARLGGEAGVTRIVDDFVNLAAPDPKVDFFRGGKYKPTEDAIVKMKRELVEQISQATGGPLKYKGPDMKTVHKGMGITDAQFNAAAADLKKALVKNKVVVADVKKILDAVGGYRKDIVEPKKPVDKKPEDKKPEDKKPEDKKPVDKKPVDKKPEDKKPEDKKPVDKKPVDKKPEDKKPEDKKPVDKKPEDTTKAIYKKREDKKPADKKAAASASVTGKVIYKGKPLTDAIVSFISYGGDVASIPIAKDGSYTVERLKPGAYQVTINPPVARPGGPKPVAIPEKYSRIPTSGLIYTVKEGKQTHDIKLAD